jgi:hypothetical protein
MIETSDHVRMTNHNTGARKALKRKVEDTSFGSIVEGFDLTEDEGDQIQKTAHDCKQREDLQSAEITEIESPSTSKTHR